MHHVKMRLEFKLHSLEKYLKEDLKIAKVKEYYDDLISVASNVHVVDMGVDSGCLCSDLPRTENLVC
jgi:hypothetical protein